MPNRLAHEKSPYLRQHADNPVDWYPWGEAALAKAHAEQKPVFLSIGYSTCHWCHVMAHESFESPAVAEVLNRDFVPVKVDREERPDLDRVYMTYVQHTTGHGGWPMSVWLTPEGKPFHGGTYFPPEDRQGRPGFVTVLNAITRHWREQRPKLETGASEVVEALRRYAAEGGAHEIREKEGAPAPLPETAAGALALAAGEAFERGFQYFYEAHDPNWGGFGGAPKFPRASVVNFLFRVAALQGVHSEVGQEAVRMATHTLQKMAEGGLHDHVGGGFHRYSVDERWHVPHFEKMLYDQAQIARNYLEARQATGREVFAWIARGIFDYVQRDLTGPHGEFYSAEDADSESPEGEVGRVAPGEPPPAAHHGSSGGLALPASNKPAHAEGAFYVWTKAEIEAALAVGGVPSQEGRPAKDGEFFCAHFGVKPEGNVAHDPQGEFRGKNVLMQWQSLAVTAPQHGLDVLTANEKLLGCLAQLRAVRAQRPRPQRDDKVITAWNGLMISALAKGQQILGAAPPPARSGRGEGAAAPGTTARRDDPPYLAAATRAAEFLRHELYDAATGTLHRSWREGRSHTAGFAEDYAYLIQGLLDLYETGFDLRWLQWAEKLQARMDELFWDAERGGYFNSRADDATVIVRLKEDYDGAEPASNSVAAMNLLRMEWMMGDGDVGGVPSPREASFPRGEGTPPIKKQTYRERALRTIEALRAQWSRAPQALPQMLCALELAMSAPRTVVLAGDPQAEDFRALAAVAHAELGPRRALLCADGCEGQRWLASRRPYLADLRPREGRATAYLCENHACQAPADSPAALAAALRPG